MARHLPDSTSLVNFARGRPVERHWFQVMLNSAEEVGCCPITIAECLAGATPTERAGWREFFASFAFWPILPDDAIQAGTWRYDFARRGLQLKLDDLLIAAVARRLDAIVVTENVKDFPMDGVRVVSLYPA